MKNALQMLLKSLEKIELEHGEIRDTAVREVLSNVIAQSFISLEPNFELPNDFAMYTDEGDAQVRSALLQFLSHPEINAEAVRRLTPEERLTAFHEDDDIFSDCTCLGDYFGHA